MAIFHFPQYKHELFCWYFKRLNVFKMLMMHGICFYGLLGIRLNLKRLVVFINIIFPIHVHFMLDYIMLLFGVTCAILLTIILYHVLIMHAMLNLTSHYPGTILMLS